MYIYKITNTVNGKVYIGKTKDPEKRWQRHLYFARAHKNRKLYDSMNHYGYETFQFEVIEACDDEEIDDRERYYIAQYNATDANYGYNTTAGGDGGDTFSNNPNKESLRRKFSEVHKGFRHSEYSKSIMREKALKREPCSDETKRKISDSLKKYFNDNPEAYSKTIKVLQEYQQEHSHPMLGKKHTTQAKLAMSSARKGKKYEEIMGKEKAIALSEFHRNAWESRNNPKYKDVDRNLIVNTICSAATIDEAALKLGMSKNGLYYKCHKLFSKTPAEIKRGYCV